MSELLPCMCGLTPALLDCEGGQAIGFSRCYRASCDCGIEQTTWDGSRADAIERWNRRTPQPVTPAGGEVGVQTLVARLESEARLLIACLGRSENASDVRVMREAADFIRSHPPVADAALARDAERWRALVGSARVRVLGSAGILGDVDPNGAPFNGYAHIGLELWTQHSAGNSPADASFMLTRYADIAALNQRGGDRG